VLLLAQQGIRVFMHGASGQTQGRLYTESVLKSLGIPIANSLTTAAEQLQHSHFSYLPLNAFCAKLNQLIDLRELLGLRSAVHTVVRLLNPFQARCTIQGIFHPNYRNLHQQAALLLEQPYMSVFKGEGGEIERNPDVECLVQSVIEGQLQEELWPALFQRRHLKPAELQPIQLQAIWSGETTDEFAQTSIIGTAAIALKLLGMAENQQQAYQLAENYWQSRQREKFLLNSEKM
jgi:anthranilate phosphoribosyltransferase